MVTDNHYRWDFIGLSTDTKPTPETSEKVVDGSTFYCSDTSKLYVFCQDNWYERKPLGGGGGGGGSYTAGNGIDITNDTISVDTTVVQEKLTAGSNITITNNTISATGGGGDSVYSTKTTSNSGDGGAVYIGGKNANQDIYPDPTVTDNHYRYFWALPFNNNETAYTDVPGNETLNIGGFQGGGGRNVTIGFRTRSAGNSNVAIGWQAGSSLANGSAVSIGDSAYCDQTYGVALGRDARVNQGHTGSIALGADARTTRRGEVNVGTVNNNLGYNNTAYRVIGGVHDGQLAQDAVTVAQVNATIDAINTALSTNIPHIGA